MLKMYLPSSYPKCRWVCFFIWTDFGPLQWISISVINMNSYFNFRQTHSFLLHKTLIDEPFMWITVMFYMSCLDGTHSLQRMIRSWCKATFLQICSNKETNSSTYWITWGWVTLNYYFYNLITRPRTNWYVFFFFCRTQKNSFLQMIFMAMTERKVFKGKNLSFPNWMLLYVSEEFRK